MDVSTLHTYIQKHNNKTDGCDGIKSMADAKYLRYKRNHKQLKIMADKCRDFLEGKNEPPQQVIPKRVATLSSPTITFLRPKRPNCRRQEKSKRHAEWLLQQEKWTEHLAPKALPQTLEGLVEERSQINLRLVQLEAAINTTVALTKAHRKADMALLAHSPRRRKVKRPARTAVRAVTLQAALRNSPAALHAHYQRKRCQIYHYLAHNKYQRARRLAHDDASRRLKAQVSRCVLFVLCFVSYAKLFV